MVLLVVEIDTVFWEEVLVGGYQPQANSHWNNEGGGGSGYDGDHYGKLSGNEGLQEVPKTWYQWTMSSNAHQNITFHCLDSVIFSLVILFIGSGSVAVAMTEVVMDATVFPTVMKHKLS